MASRIPLFSSSAGSSRARAAAATSLSTAASSTGHRSVHVPVQSLATHHGKGAKKPRPPQQKGLYAFPSSVMTLDQLPPNVSKANVVALAGVLKALDTRPPLATHRADEHMGPLVALPEDAPMVDTTSAVLPGWWTERGRSFKPLELAPVDTVAIPAQYQTVWAALSATAPRDVVDGVLAAIEANPTVRPPRELFRRALLATAQNAEEASRLWDAYCKAHGAELDMVDYWLRAQALKHDGTAGATNQLVALLMDAKKKGIALHPDVYQQALLCNLHDNSRAAESLFALLLKDASVIPDDVVLLTFLNGVGRRSKQDKWMQTICAIVDKFLVHLRAHTPLDEQRSLRLDCIELTVKAVGMRNRETGPDASLAPCLQLFKGIRDRVTTMPAPSSTTAWDPVSLYNAAVSGLVASVPHRHALGAMEVVLPQLGSSHPAHQLTAKTLGDLLYVTYAAMRRLAMLRSMQDVRVPDKVNPFSFCTNVVTAALTSKVPLTVDVYENLLKCMEQLEPDSSTVRSAVLVSGTAVSPLHYAILRKIKDHMTQAGLAPSLDVYNTLLGNISRQNDRPLVNTEVKRLFSQEMQPRQLELTPTVAANLLLCGLVPLSKKRLAEQAREPTMTLCIADNFYKRFFKPMLAKSGPAETDVVVPLNALKVVARLGRLRDLNWLWINSREQTPSTWFNYDVCYLREASEIVQPHEEVPSIEYVMPKAPRAVNARNILALYARTTLRDILRGHTNGYSPHMTLHLMRLCFAAGNQALADAVMWAHRKGVHPSYTILRVLDPENTPVSPMPVANKDPNTHFTTSYFMRDVNDGDEQDDDFDDFMSEGLLVEPQPKQHKPSKPEAKLATAAQPDRRSKRDNRDHDQGQQHQPKDYREIYTGSIPPYLANTIMFHYVRSCRKARLVRIAEVVMDNKDAPSYPRNVLDAIVRRLNRYRLMTERMQNELLPIVRATPVEHYKDYNRW